MTPTMASQQGISANGKYPEETNGGLHALQEHDQPYEAVMEIDADSAPSSDGITGEVHPRVGGITLKADDPDWVWIHAAQAAEQDADDASPEPDECNAEPDDGTCECKWNIGACPRRLYR
eukprot:TRINITY_DN365_c1_g4_i1.p3 TRINITY_DN365_c1_g4~~TRINITY_DN365_c1_g4_i1.p3  ORF type:complete len:120 (-),score=9.53 TRINITY_DN365_c1_g4_i1:478-837(-)